MQQFARQAVAHVHHRCGADAQLPQFLDDVTAGFGFELSFNDVLLSREIGLEILVFHLSTHATLALQQLQAHIGCTQVAAHADEVGVAGSCPIDDVVLGRLAQTGHADDESRDRSARVAAHQIHAIMLTGDAHALIELLDVLQGEALADAQRHRHLARCAVHGKHIAQVDHDGLVAQVHQGHVGKVKVDALKQQVGCDQCLPVVAVVDDGTVITHTTSGRWIANGKRASQVFNQPKFAQGRNFSFLHDS